MPQSFTGPPILVMAPYLGVVAFSPEGKGFRTRVLIGSSYLGFAASFLKARNVKLGFKSRPHNWVLSRRYFDLEKNVIRYSL